MEYPFCQDSKRPSKANNLEIKTTTEMFFRGRSGRPKALPAHQHDISLLLSEIDGKVFVKVVKKVIHSLEGYSFQLSDSDISQLIHFLKNSAAAAVELRKDIKQQNEK